MAEEQNVPTVDATSGLAADKGKMTSAMDGVEDDAKLLASVGDSLAEAFGEAPEKTAVPAPPKRIVKTEPDPEPVVDQTQDEPVVDQTTDDPPTEIPVNYVRAALRSGWTEEAIQDLADKAPDMALQTMQNIYESQKTISDKFSQLGRTVPQPQVQATEQPAQQPAQQPAPQKGFVDFAALKNEYGNDPLIETVIKPLDAALVELRAQINQAPATPTPDPESTKLPAELAREVGIFFGDETLTKHYGGFYGTSNDPMALTLGQVENRNNVLIKADQIIAGAAMQGINMTVDEALDSAHMLVSEPVKASAIRREIKESAVKRSSGISLRPSSAKQPGSEGTKPRTQKELEDKVAAGLRNCNL